MTDQNKQKPSTAKASSAANVRLLQKYDGNKYNPRSYTRGHLFYENSEVALCGFKFKHRSAPVIEKEYNSYEELPFIPELKKLCLKCHDIACRA
jgi:hypothetical protein